jgi:7,8-dihydro-6-hydroxymethylpterin-pyrophosphokinase
LEKNVSLLGEEEIKESSQLPEKLPQLLEIVKEMKEIKKESHNPREIDADLVAKIGEELLSQKRFSEFKDLMLDSKVPDEF